MAGHSSPLVTHPLYLYSQQWHSSGLKTGFHSAHPIRNDSFCTSTTVANHEPLGGPPPLAEMLSDETAFLLIHAFARQRPAPHGSMVSDCVGGCASADERWLHFFARWKRYGFAGLDQTQQLANHTCRPSPDAIIRTPSEPLPAGAIRRRLKPQPPRLKHVLMSVFHCVLSLYINLFNGPLYF